MVSAKCVQAAASALGFERTVMKVVQRPGVVNVLGVVGQSGCMIKLEVALTEGRGGVSINEAAGAMARDAARHAFFAVNALTGGALNNKNAVFNCLGGGSVDGPSIGLAASLALYSALKGVSIPQTLAVTGEVALSGEVLPVGGIQEKLQAAARYGIESVFLPDQNPCDAQGWDLDLFPVSHLKRAFELLAL